MMTPRERVWAALNGQAVDRPPVSFWGHVYHRESSADDLAAATLDLQREYRWDWVKLNPRKHYHVEPWGVRYLYSGRPGEKPKLESWPIHSASDWRKITRQPFDRGALGEQLEAVRQVRRGLPDDVALIETVFTPLAVLGEMIDEPSALRRHMDESPDDVRAALEAVTETYEAFIPAVLAAGADGIYFATVDWGARPLMTPDSYRAWARPTDLRVMAAASAAPFNVLHVCRGDSLLLEVTDYPVQALSWAATDPTNPTLDQALARTRAAVMGGVSHEGAIVHGTPDDVIAEIVQGFERTQGRRWLVAPGCSIPPAAHPEHLRTARDAVENLMSSGRAP
jgi:uroporphyrinogen decarboxylase